MSKDAILVLIFVLVLGVGGYFFLMPKKDEQPTTGGAGTGGGTGTGGAGTGGAVSWTPDAQTRVLMTNLSREVGDWDRNAVEWGSMAQVIRDNLREDPDTNPRIQGVVLGFLKGFDLKPTGWATQLAIDQIKTYVANGGPAEPLVSEGQFLAV